MNSRAVGRDRTRRVRGKSRLREAFEETLSENLTQVLEGRGQSPKIITEYNRAVQDINRDVALINRRSREETSDLEKDETKTETDKAKLRQTVKNEEDAINRRLNLVDAQTQSESRRVHLLAQRGGRIITQNATLPAHEQRGTEVIQTEVETGTRRLLELQEQKAELEGRKHKLNQELTQELNRKEEQLVTIKERKRRLTMEKEQQLANKETERARIAEDTKQHLQETR